MGRSFDVRMTVSHEAFLRYVLTGSEPVLIVSDDEGETVLACNPSARGLFALAGDEPLPALRTLLPHVRARAIAIDGTKVMRADRFVRAVALGTSGREVVSVSVKRLPIDAPAALAVTIHDEALRLHDRAEAQVSEARLQFALDSALIGDWDMDLRTNVAFRSPLHDACFGYAEPLADWGYDTFLAHVHADDRQRVDQNFQAARDGRSDYDVEFRVVWPDGSIHWLWSKGRFYHDENGIAIRVAGIQVDISHRKRIEERVRLASLAMASTTDAIVIADVALADFPIVYVNEAFETMTGYTAEQIHGVNCRILQGGDSDQPEIAQMRKALARGEATRVTLRNYRRDGTLFWNKLTLSPVFDEVDRLTHYVGVLSDVTSNKVLEAELLTRANHDPLTGLANGRLLQERLEAAIHNANQTGRIVGAAFIDIDRLKYVNDSLGHTGGDAVIRAVASCLRRVIRPIDTVARFGGDEFVIVFPELDDVVAAEVILDRLRRELRTPLTIDGVELTPSASIGIALYPQDAASAGDLIRVADTAMYAAKANDRGSYQFFDARRMHVASDRLGREGSLRTALEKNQFVLEYQPIFDAADTIVALEALVRWRKSDGTIVAPADFIPLAEECGLIVPLGEWILAEICRQIGAWRRAGCTCVPVAMNASIAQLRRADFVETFDRIVVGAGIDAHLIVIEVTESIVMDNPELFLDVLNTLRGRGVRVAIDDFGTGFSSLSYLKRLSLDTLKIDKSFVHDIITDVNAAAICHAIVNLGHTVGLRTLAEGVETAAQAVYLRAIGCDEMQGFYFARPAAPQIIEPMLRGAPVATG